MKHFLIVGITYETEIPESLMDRILKLYDSDKEVDLNSDDFVTVYPETNKGKKIAINMHFESKDYKTAVFNIMVKAHTLGRGWKVLGPVKMKQYFFAMTLDKEFSDEVPDGVLGLSIVLSKGMTE